MDEKGLEGGYGRIFSQHAGPKRVQREELPDPLKEHRQPRPRERKRTKLVVPTPDADPGGAEVAQKRPSEERAPAVGVPPRRPATSFR